jgi:hypothetical protein
MNIKKDISVILNCKPECTAEDKTYLGYWGRGETLPPLHHVPDYKHTQDH